MPSRCSTPPDTDQAVVVGLSQAGAWALQLSAEHR